MFTISVLTAVTVVAAGDGRKFDPPQGPALEVRIMLTDVLAKIEDSALEASEQIRLLSAAISEAVKELQPHSPVADSLSGALVDSSQQASDTRLALLKQVVSDVLADLQFEPIAEAGLPKGFPTYTSVGTIEVKEYPEYRMAAGPGFWTLFMHIQSNGIAMTAPVEMTYEASGAGEVKEAGMAFLYGDQSIGQPGRSGTVEVIDHKRRLSSHLESVAGVLRLCSPTRATDYSNGSNRRRSTG